MSISISEGYRPGCIGRIAQLHAIHYAATTGFGVAFEAKVATELSEFCRDYKQDRDGIWLAMNPQVEGSVILDGRNSSDIGAHLRWFITSDEIRGNGVGRTLLTQALAFADQRRYGKVYLWTFEGLGAARHLYAEFGFKLVHESPGNQWSTVVTEQRYERSAA